MEICCGGIIVYKDKYLLIQHSRGLHWDFPKGHQEPGETEQQTAKREIFEEVGLRPKIIPDFQASITYHNHLDNVDKTVIFFLFQSTTDKVTINDEIQAYKWLTYQQALQQLTYQNAKNVLEQTQTFRNTL